MSLIMTIKVSYQKKVSKKTSSNNLILFADEKFNIGSSKKYLSILKILI